MLEKIIKAIKTLCHIRIPVDETTISQPYSNYKTYTQRRFVKSKLARVYVNRTFDKGSSFGKNSVFIECEFGKSCKFDSHCTFINCGFDSSCNFGMWCKFSQGCAFDDCCEFSNYCSFSPTCYFDGGASKYKFGNYCNQHQINNKDLG